MENYINELERSLSDLTCCPEGLKKFFKLETERLMELIHLYHKLTPTYFQSTLSVLQKENNYFFKDYSVSAYKGCYANPLFAQAQFGEELGQIVAYIAYTNYLMISYTFKKDKFILEKWLGTYIELMDQLGNDQERFEIIKERIQEYQIEVNTRNLHQLVHRYSGYSEYYESILMKQNESLNYLFEYGDYISENEVQIAETINRLDQVTLNKMAENIVFEGYIKAFKIQKKDYSKKKTVQLRFVIGFEKLVLRVIELLKKEMGMTQFTVESIKSTEINQQLSFDHQYDNALYLDTYYQNTLIERFDEISEGHKEQLKGYSGIIVIDSFGDKPFYPQIVKEAISLSKEQTRLYSEYITKIGSKLNQYAPRSEWSFTIVAYPVPEIGPQFEAIFSETIELNTLDSLKYEVIQQKMIQCLDKGQYVHVTGRNGNRTDIRVAMQLLKDKNNETLFSNCTTGLNIPVGEVYTTPRLDDTHGILHIKEVFLRDLRFIDLELKFQSGMVVDYNCKNFQTDEENKKYILENLLFPHTTLPLGEFAIGTNTKAYSMGKKYGISHLLPILIAEKTGPHFAIGDTCFTWSEESKVYNSDGKEIIARENAITCKRKTNPNEAYYNVHTDITIPYSELGDISVIQEGLEPEFIIQQGRFVLDGTEELNKYL